MPPLPSSSSLGGNIPLPGPPPPPPACPCPLPSAHLPAPSRLLQFSPAQRPRPRPSLCYCPVCSTSWGRSYLAVRSPSTETEASAAEGSGLCARRTTGEILFDLHKLED